MNLSKPYNRSEFISFLENNFLPDDFRLVEEKLAIDDFKTQFCKDATKLGSSKSMGLDVYEIMHTSSHDARVGISKDAFQILLRKSYNNRALVLFVPEGSRQYRFSLIQIDAEVNDQTARIKRSYSNPRRYSFLLGEGAHIKTPEQFLKEKGKLKPKDGDYFPDLLDRFSVEVLTKQFYQELFAWYQWALSDNDGFEVTYPNDICTEADDRKIDKHIIRLITRLMFVWFIKQKKLVPEKIFKKAELTNLLADFDPDSKTAGNYYNAILQNLFFATLNKKISEREFAKNGSFLKQKEHFGIKTLFRDANEKSWFKVGHSQILDLFNEVPFMNGGLFECLDKSEHGKTMYYDGFSRAAGRQKRAFLPNCLFFEKEKGIITLLEKYNFTVVENTPSDVEVALDPELLGKVFENLLGAFNEETKETARKQSGSFYTPREIVNYMVDESIIAYLNHTCSEIGENAIRLLFKDDIQGDEIILSNASKTRLVEALKSVKMLDPACGSGAFPMGMLNRMLYLLKKLQPAATANDYDLKLHLIENCIYGVDIQTIAVQISKLRFFISLICEQEKNPKKDNYGIVALPNLETKFVAANTLIGIKKDFSDKLDLQNKDLTDLKEQLLDVRHKHFLAPNAHEKHKLRELDEQLRNRIKTFLIDSSTKPNTYKIKLLKEQIAELNKQKKQYEGEKWEDTTIAPQQQATIDFGFEPAPELQPSIFRVDVNKQKRNEIDAQIRRIENDMVREESKSKNDVFEDEADKLAHWNPYDQNTSSVFFDMEWMFGIKEGFDLVIGNPPYVNLANIKPDSYRINLKEKFYSARNKSDLYAFFIEQGFAFLTSTGKMAYIIPHTWKATDSFRNLREIIFKNKSLIQIVNLEMGVFDAIVKPLIAVFSNENSINNKISVFNQKFELECIIPVIEILESPNFELDSTSNLLMKKLYQKIELNSVLLEKIIQFSRGIKTSDDKRFIQSAYKEDCYKVYRGKNIKAYSLNWNNEYIWYRPDLMKEKVGCVPNSREFFEVPEKLVTQRVNSSFKLLVAYDNSQNYFMDTVNVSRYSTWNHNISLKYLCGLLNSKLINFWYCNKFSMPTIGIYELHSVPIKISENQTQIIKYVDEILSSKQENPQSDTTVLERQIDELVYKLYDLTYAEVQVVEEGKFWLSEGEYEKIKIE